MKKSRLLRLAKLLEDDAVKPDGIKFDLRIMVSRPPDLPTGAPIPVNCGAAACAIGLWGLSGKFRGVTYDLWDGWPRYKGLSGRDAADAYFELTERQSQWLFLSDKYPQKKITGAVGEMTVAKRIRDFVAGKANP